MMTWLILIGGFTTTELIARMQSNILPFGIASFVLTGSRFCAQLSTNTVEVKILVGLVSSRTAYVYPFLHLFPVTTYSED
jgi:hypothetical protein